MESEYGMYRRGSSGWSSMVGNEEFQETDIWSVLNERKSFDSKKFKESSSSKTICFPSAARMIPKSTSSTTTNNNNNLEVPQQQSAPVNIPDWSKIYGNKSKRSSKNYAWHDDDGHDDGRENWDSDDDDDDDNGNMMPPHEWIAKKLARSQISSFSVCEGAGRTLKGRDLSRVRNAVLTKTGFLE